MSRQALQGASFVDVKQQREAIDHFICVDNGQAAPFEWRKQKSNNSLCSMIALTCSSELSGQDYTTMSFSSGILARIS
jgi:hypothetical protein